MDYRLTKIPAPLWRIVRDKAGPQLREVVIALLTRYADGEIDPLAEHELSQEQATSALTAAMDKAYPGALKLT